MSTAEIVVLVVVVLVLVVALALVLARQRKSKALRSQFGPEYDRTVEGSGGRRDAERELSERAERRRTLDVRPLSEQDRRAYGDRWRSTQADFVDRPSMAVRSADVLVAEVMGKRGYPVGDFDQQARDVSVDHADVVQEYRAAHEISELNDREQATTEQLRQAMVHYRSLFTALLDDGRTAEAGTSEGSDVEGRGTTRAAAVGDPASDDRARNDDSRDVGDRRPGDQVDDRPTRTVVDGGLVQPADDRTARDGTVQDRGGDVRPR